MSMQVGNVNYVNSYRDSLKQRQKMGVVLAGTGGLAGIASAHYIKSNAVGLSLLTIASLATILGVVDFHKTAKELKELDNQQKLNIEI
ncbi:MAG: hypothetical protein BHW55_01880 [Candidatus Melainabacteria bacterium 35_41]|nr:MAG: hypothetical protein BHW55_01880 [Candidatus Melainabacteria bacterium 35_41]